MRIIQISDIHLFNNKNSSLKGYNTYCEFTKVIEYINLNYSFDLLVISGDLSEDGTLQSYQILKSTIADLLSKTIILPGNHDNIANLNHIFGPYIKDFHAGEKINLHFLDSTVDNEIFGRISDEKIKSLAKRVSEYEVSSLVFLHHHPYETGYKWLDRYGLKNSQSFIEELEQTKKVKAIFHGHIHSDFLNKTKSFPIYSCPATSFTFQKREDDEYVKDERGFNVIDILNQEEVNVEQVLLSSLKEE